MSEPKIDIMFISISRIDIEKKILFLEFRDNDVTIKRIKNKINKALEQDGFKFYDIGLYINDEDLIIEVEINGVQGVPISLLSENNIKPFDSGYILKINDDGTETYEKLSYRDFFKIETLKGLL